MRVRIYWNADPTGGRFLTGYLPEHAPFMRVAADAKMEPPDEEWSDIQACEVLFAAFNDDNRPNAQVAPSMSVGDVVVLDYGEEGQRAYTACVLGFERIDFDPTWDRHDDQGGSTNGSVPH